MTAQHVLSDADAQTYLEAGITPREVVLLRWPNLVDVDVEWSPWELTPLPPERGLHALADIVAAMNWQPEPE